MILLLFLTGCLYASTTATERPHYDLNKAQDYFEDFILTHKRVYDVRTDEKQRRFEIFKENLKIINRLNSLNESVHGITDFADLSAAEFKEKTSCLGPDNELLQGLCTAFTDAHITGVTAPDSLDYRQRDAVSPVKNQGPCQSCWAFTTVGSLEGSYAIKHGQLVSLSAAQLMDCLTTSGKCTISGNSLRQAFQELVGAKGVMLESDYPYVPEDSPCKFIPGKAKVKVTGCSYLTLSNEEYMKEALVQRGPIGVILNVTLVQHYIGGIISEEVCPPDTPNHGVLLVGYGTEENKNYWILKNSWGPNWGEAGYMRLARGQNVCGVHNRHAIVGTVE